jgi:uracil-DNA glycosylase family 4
MSESNSLRPEKITAEVAALAEHLHRSGVQFVPVADPQAVESLSASLAASTPAAPVTSGSTPPVAGPGQAVAGAAPPLAAPPLAATSGPRSATPVTSPTPTPPTRSTAPVAPTDAILEEYRGAALPVDQRHRELESLGGPGTPRGRCRAVGACRTQTVFGEGSPTPRFAFFGEGPGMEEDRTGRPFVGKAGQLLTKMIEACTFRREDVYILNTVKCRPPNNRNPEPEEIEHCREYFEHQLSILRPEYIVCLGAVSSRALLQSKLSVGLLRGRLHRYFESKVLVTYHPAYLLRTPAAKKAAWEDLQLMLRDAGIDPRAKQ